MTPILLPVHPLIVVTVFGTKSVSIISLFQSETPRGSDPEIPNLTSDLVTMVNGSLQVWAGWGRTLVHSPGHYSQMLLEEIKFNERKHYC